MTIDDVVYFANHKFGEIAYLVEDKDKYLLMTSSSKWKILKDDFPRFHCYVLYHSNNLSLEGFHRQSIGTNLAFLIFDAIRHDSPEMNKMSWEEFSKLAKSHKQNERILSSGDTNGNFVSRLDHIIIFHAAAHQAH